MNSPTVKNITPARRYLWGVIAAITVFIYATLPVMRGVLRFLYRHLGRGELSIAVNIMIIVAMIAFIAYLLFHRRIRNPFDIGTVVLVFLATGFSLTVIEIPEERVHFLEYSLLGALIFTAWSLDLKGNQLYLASLALTSLLGGIDEFIQYFLPNRVGEFRDFLLNLVGGMIGIVVAWVLHRPPEAGKTISLKTTGTMPSS